MSIDQHIPELEVLSEEQDSIARVTADKSSAVPPPAQSSDSGPPSATNPPPFPFVARGGNNNLLQGYQVPGREQRKVGGRPQSYQQGHPQPGGYNTQPRYAPTQYYQNPGPQPGRPPVQYPQQPIQPGYPAIVPVHPPGAVRPGYYGPRR